MPVDSGDSVQVDSAPTFWRVVRQALRGERHDYTVVSLNRAVLLLAIPMVLEMVMESLFAFMNVFWVSHLGRDAVAVVGLTEAIMLVIYAVAIGTSLSATAIVARRIGAGDSEKASRAAGQVILFGVTVSAAIGIVLSFFAADSLRLMGADEAIVALGTDFARVMLSCNVTVFMIFLINAVFRGAGDAVLAMRTLWFANALNIVLGPCFIFGWGPFPEMGVTGAAVATNIGRGTGVLYQLWHLAGASSRIRLRLQHLRPAIADLRTIASTSGSGMLQPLMGVTSALGMIKILAMSGSVALAGYTIAMRVVMFALLPTAGLANAGATLVGQNLGAGRPERAEQAVKIASRLGSTFLGAVGLCFVFFATPIAAIFTSEPELMSEASRALRIISFGLPFNAAAMCFAAAFNGAGDTWTPTRVTFFCMWLGQIPLAWLLAGPLGLNALGVYVAVPIALAVWTLVMGVLFLEGNWKHKKI